MEKKEKSNKNQKQANTETDYAAVWKIWDIHEPFSIPDTQFTIKGYSVAALRTNFFIKELGIMLDAGLSSPNYTIEHIFITHGHADHTANAPFHIYAKKENMKIQMYAPREMTKFLKSYVESAYLLSSDCDFEALNIQSEDLYLYNYYEMKSVSSGDKFEINIKNRNYTVEVIKCYHSVPCVGYGLIEKRQKLKEEYKHLSGKEIGELRKKGENINYIQDCHFLLFLGDTSKEILKDENIKKYKTIMIECTFLYDDDLDQAEKTFHIHWKDLEPFVEENPNITFVLYHFSQRYKQKELIDFFEKVELKNIFPWIN